MLIVLIFEVMALNFYKETNPSNILSSTIYNDTCYEISQNYNATSYTINPGLSENDPGICYAKVSNNIYEFEFRNKTHNYAQQCSYSFVCESSCNSPFLEFAVFKESYCYLVYPNPSPPEPPQFPPPPPQPLVSPFQPASTTPSCSSLYDFSDNLFKPIPHYPIGDTYSFQLDFGQVEVFEKRNNVYELENYFGIETCCASCRDVNDCIGIDIEVDALTIKCKYVGLLYGSISKYVFDDSYNHRRKFSLRHKTRSSLHFLPPPPPFVQINEDIINIILQPQVLIPSIFGLIVLLLIITYLFRECTNERASAFAKVFDTILGRSKPQIVVT